MKAVEPVPIDQSSLAQFVRRGKEGRCLACHKPVTAHVSDKGQWLGCSNSRLPEATTFVLVPAEPVRESRHLATAVANDTAPALATAPAPHKPHRATRTPGVVYVGKFALDHKRVRAIESERDRTVYRLIRLERDKGATRAALLAALKAGEHTGIVDGAVRRLRLLGVVKAERVA